MAISLIKTTNWSAFRESLRIDEVPDEEGNNFINDLLRPIGMYLYGRKVYETVAIWEAPDVIPGRTPAGRKSINTAAAFTCGLSPSRAAVHALSITGR